MSEDINNNWQTGDIEIPESWSKLEMKINSPEERDINDFTDLAYDINRGILTMVYVKEGGVLAEYSYGKNDGFIGDVYNDMRKRFKDILYRFI